VEETGGTRPRARGRRPGAPPARATFCFRGADGEVAETPAGFWGMGAQAHRLRAASPPGTGFVFSRITVGPVCPPGAPSWRSSSKKKSFVDCRKEETIGRRGGEGRSTVEHGSTPRPGPYPKKPVGEGVKNPRKLSAPRSRAGRRECGRRRDRSTPGDFGSGGHVGGGGAELDGVHHHRKRD